MRRIFVLTILGIGALVSAAAAQVSTDDGGGISSLHRRDGIPPGRQATEAGDGIDVDDLGNMKGDLNTEPYRSVRAERDRPERTAEAGEQGVGERRQAAPGTRSLSSPSRNTGSRAAAAGPRGGRPENRWRYQRYNGVWWYWTPNNRWAFFNGQGWTDYNSELANQWARGGAVGDSGENAMGLGGGGYGSGGGYNRGGSYGVSGTRGVLGRGRTQSSLGGIGGLGTNAGGLGSAQIPGPGTAPGRSAIPRFRSGGGSMAAGGLGPTGAGGSLTGGAGGSVGGGAGGAVTGEGVGSSLFGTSGGMAAVPGVSGTRGSLGGASGVGITAGGRSGDANSGVGGGMVGGAGIGGTGTAARGIGAGN